MTQPESLELSANGRRFSALAMGEGPVVLFLHGFPDQNGTFRHQLPVVAGAGYRAVTPLLRGYEPSSQGRRHIPDFHPVQIASDVAEWARQLGGGAPVHLVGHDWGAVITEAVCAQYPDLLRSATTLAVPPAAALERGIRKYPAQLRNSWYMLFFQLRGLSDRVVAARDFAFLEKLWRDWSPGWEWDAEDMQALKWVFAQPGVVWSALAYYRAMLNPFLQDSRTMRARMPEPIHVPTLAITGATDGCMDTRIYDGVDPGGFSRGYRMERVEGAGHFVQLEKPDVVSRLLLDWLAEQDR